MPIVNVEIKARSSNRESLREILAQHRAVFRGSVRQVDTYFRTSTGRLKLRESDTENYLVYYHRPDQKGPKESHVVLYHTRQNSHLKQILSQSLGVLITVVKRREIYELDNVKFHLDDVTALGTFMEIEAVDETGDLGKERLTQQCQHFMEVLGIKKSDLVSSSYGDLLRTAG